MTTATLNRKPNQPTATADDHGRDQAMTHKDWCSKQVCDFRGLDADPTHGYCGVCQEAFEAALRSIGNGNTSTNTLTTTPQPGGPMYVTQDGETVTREQVQQAFEAGKARLVHGYRDASQGGSSVNTSLRLDDEDFDTRDECESVWEAVWTREPKTLRECLQAAAI